jgi:hypothetical protein
MRKEEEYEEGSQMTADTLMNLAANKYKIRLRRDEWNSKSESETKILALEAKLQTLQKRDKPRSPAKKGSSNKDSKNSKKLKGGGDKVKLDKPAWMTKTPSAAEKGKSKTVSDKEYWWCDALECWCRHHPSKCEAKKKQGGGKSEKKKLKFASAMETVTHDEDSEEEE